jgi:hypothetical protein
MIVHIVLFQPKKEVSREQREAFVQSLQRATSEIPQVQRAQVGKAVEVGTSYESRSGRITYDFAALLEFATLDDLRTYLEHPLHKSLGTMFWQTCESTMILDAEVADSLAELLD